MRGWDQAYIFRQSLQGRLEACAAGWGDHYKAHGTSVGGGTVRGAWCLGRLRSTASSWSLFEGESSQNRRRSSTLGREGLAFLFPRWPVMAAPEEIKTDLTFTDTQENSVVPFYLLCDFG